MPWIGAEGIARMTAASSAPKSPAIAGQLKGRYAFSDVWDGTLRYSFVGIWTKGQAGLVSRRRFWSGNPDGAVGIGDAGAAGDALDHVGDGLSDHRWRRASSSRVASTNLLGWRRRGAHPNCR
jgi:hypothetical protein